MRVGIATDHSGFGLKEELVAQLKAGGHEVVDFGAHKLTPDDDYPDYVVPLAQAVVAGNMDWSKYAPAFGVARGAYVLTGTPDKNPEVILLASGSEVSLAVQAHEKLAAEGVRPRVVSMPSWDIFEHQSQEYRDGVLLPGLTARVAVEQASTFGWERYVGMGGRVIGMKTFGASAPLKELQKRFGFEPDQVAAAAKELLGRN